MRKNNNSTAGHVSAANKTLGIICIILGVFIILFGLVGLTVMVPLAIIFIAIGAVVLFFGWKRLHKTKQLSIETAPIEKACNNGTHAETPNFDDTTTSIATEEPIENSTINDFTEKSTPPVQSQQKYKHEKHYVAGVSYRIDNLLSVCKPNPAYEFNAHELSECFYQHGDKVYEYESDAKTINLMPEPENESDENAVKVLVNDVHIGYIKKGSCKHILNLLESEKITDISIEIGGGKYKKLFDDYDSDTDKMRCYFTRGTDSNYFAVLDLKIKE